MSEHRGSAGGSALFPLPGTTLPWVLTGPGAAAVRARAEALRTRLSETTDWSPAGVAHALAAAPGTGRRTHRAVILAGNRPQTLDALGALAAGTDHPAVLTGGPLTTSPAGPVLVFPGQGSQWAAMARELLDTTPVFARKLHDCAEAFAPYLDHSLLDSVQGTPDGPALVGADVVQPALFSVMVALADLWRAAGVEPGAVLGHSLGELAAAHVCGALSLDDSARVVARWSQAQATLAGRGDMVSVLLPAAELAELIDRRWPDRLVVAAQNSPGSAVVSGDDDAAAELVAHLAAQGVHARRIDVGLAAHSPHVDAILPRVRQDIAPIRAGAPRIPVYSSVLGGALVDTPMDAAYWCRNLRSPVRFADATRAALEAGHTTLIEVSPHPVLTTAMEVTAADAARDATILATVRRREGGPGRFLVSLAEFHAAGGDIDLDVVLPADDAAPFLLPDAVLTAGSDEDPAGGTPAEVLRARLAPLGPAERRADLLSLVRECVTAVLDGDGGDGGDGAVIDGRRTFRDLGLTSLAAVGIRDRLHAATGLRLSPTVVFDRPTPDALAAHLDAELFGAPAAAPAAERPATPHDEPLAIVGMACRYPGGVASPDDLWHTVASGTDAIGPLPTDRGWNITEGYDPELGGPGRFSQREGGFLYDAAEFDAEFFGISPREALAMDPQQRLALESAWEAIEDAGIDAHTLKGSRTGVFLGLITQDYGPRAGEATAQAAAVEGHLFLGSTGSVASGRISYVLGLEGPSLTVDTACSSSLVALHEACRALRAGDCDLALTGGVTVMPSTGMLVEFSRQRGLAADGRCKAFAASADGFGMAEGVGTVLVERLSDARRLGHRVLAVVRGSAVNQDGASNGLSAPSGPAQQRVIRQALVNAGVQASEVDVVEAHGTGTRLGDPIEAQALQATYGQGRDGERPLWLGSLKSNIGHAQAAAGVGGVIKMVMAMRAGVLPRTLHADEPSPYIDWSEGQVRLLTEEQEWPEAGRPRRAGVSSFGVSGTNAHVILENDHRPTAEEEPAPAAAPGVVPWVLSAASAEALRAQAARLHDHLSQRPALSPADVALSLATRRTALEHRAVAVGADRDELLSVLDALSTGRPSSQAVLGGVIAHGRGPVFVFPGQGTQWVGMAVELLDTSPVFAESMTRCGAALAEFVEWDLLKVVRDRDAAVLEAVDVVQPVLWAVMVSLAAVWRASGVEPAAVVGHSQGEIAAACVAGGLSLRDGARVVALRSAVIGRSLAGRGGMASVALASDLVRERLAGWEGRLSLAAVNGPSSSVVCGHADALDEFTAALQADGVRVRRIAVDYASHSVFVEEAQAELLDVLQGIEPRTGEVPFYSTVTGGLLDTAELDAGYWYRNLRQTVRFEETVRELAHRGFDAFIEASAHPVLTVGVQETLEAAGAQAMVCGTLRRGEGGLRRLLASLGEAWAAGLPVNWAALLPGTHAVELPTYAFQRRRYWLDSTLGAQAERPADDKDAAFWEAVHHTDLDGFAAQLDITTDAPLGTVLPALADWRTRMRTRATVDDWRYRITWKRLPDPATAPALTGPWLAVVPEGHLQDPAVTLALEAVGRAGADVVTVPVSGSDADPKRLADRLRTTLTGLTCAPAGVLSFLGLDTARHRDHPAMPSGTATSLALVRALGRAEVAAPLWMVTRQAVAAGADTHPRAPLASLIWGLGQVTALEHADRWGGLIDLPDVLDAATARMLCAALAGDGPEDQFALRPAGTFVRRLAHVPGEQRPARRTWRPRGTVVVTGGTGALGTLLARWLAAQGAEHLVLTGRRGADAPGAAELRDELTATGVRVTLAACDIADRKAVGALLDDLATAGETVRAVLHAAGVADLTSLADTGPEAFAAGVAAKVDGALHLTELLDHGQLDAFVLFSSIAGVWGSGDHGAYAAANAFLNALAETNRAQGIPTTSIAWGVWNAFGVQGAGGISEAVDLDQLHRRGLPLIEPELGLTALQQALDRDETVLTVAPVAWERFFPLFSAARPRPLFDDLPQLRALAAEPTGTPMETADERRTGLAALPPQDRDSALLALVRGEAASVLGYERPDQLEADRALRDVGFDSLTAMELRNRLAAATGLTLPTTLVFDHPTPLALAAYLKSALFGPDAADDTSVLTELDAVAARLAALRPETNTRLEITLRLRSLLSQWSEPDTTRAGDTPGTELESASVDEVLAFIDTELGI